jgi:hypothetical protein
MAWEDQPLHPYFLWRSGHVVDHPNIQAFDLELPQQNNQKLSKRGV